MQARCCKEHEAQGAESGLNCFRMRHADGTAAKVVEIDAELKRLRNQVAAAMVVVNRGVELMPDELIGQWAGVRTFLEQDTADYEPFDESANVEWRGGRRPSLSHAGLDDATEPK